MRLKGDENLPERLAAALRGLGHDVDTVVQEGLSGCEDEALWPVVQGTGQFFLTNQAAVRSILDHLGLTPPESERPPPGVRYVPVDDGGRETAATAWVADGP